MSEADIALEVAGGESAPSPAGAASGVESGESEIGLSFETAAFAAARMASESLAGLLGTVVAAVESGPGKAGAGADSGTCLLFETAAYAAARMSSLLLVGSATAMLIGLLLGPSCPPESFRLLFVRRVDLFGISMFFCDKNTGLPDKLI